MAPPSDPRTLLVVSAHSADFVWRAAGAIATTTANGGTATVVSLSFGERGESGELWKEEGQTVDNVKAIRRAEAETAAGILGAEIVFLDRGDYPLELDGAAIEELTDVMRDLAPDVVLGHARQDPFNPDHGAASEATIRARQLASGAGVASGFRTITPPALLLFEPHQPELCGFVPTTFLDITPVWERKVAAMEAMGAQDYLRQYYAERAGHRANHARRISGRSEIRFAEAFQRDIPQVVDALVTSFDALAQLGVATVHEAQGKTGLVDIPLVQVVPGSRAAGRARTALCANGDNLMVHAAVAHAEPGDVLVLTMPAPVPVAMVGDLLATQALGQGVVAILVDGAVRDVEELRELGLPIWARYVRAQGAAKDRAGELDVPVVVGGVRIEPGDAVVLDADGAVVVPSGSIDEVVREGRAREAREHELRARYAAGERSYDVNDLRRLVEGQRPG